MTSPLACWLFDTAMQIVGRPSAALPTGAAASADKQIGRGHALLEIADETVQAPMRPCCGQCLHLCPRGIVCTGDEIHFQLCEILQRQHRVVGLHRRIETTEIHQHPPRLGLIAMAGQTNSSRSMA
jgi:hypothetical protein